MAKQGKFEKVLYLSELGALLPADALREGNGRKLRSTPIPWLKFRTPADTTDTGIRYSMRRQAVKATDRGWEKLAVYDEIFIAYGGDRIAPLRGYIVNHHLLAATAEEIGIEIRCFDFDLVKQAVQTLLKVGLLVLRKPPSFAEAIRADKTLAPRDDKPDDPNEDLLADDVPAGAEAFANDAPQEQRRRSRARAKSVSGEKKKARVKRGRSAARKPQATAPPAAGQPGRDLTRVTGDGKTPDEPGAEAASATPSPLPAPGSGRPDDQKPASAAPSPCGDGQTTDGTQDTGEPYRARPVDPTTEDGTAADSTPPDSELTPGDDTGGHTTAEPREPTEADRKAESKACVARVQPAGMDMTWHAESFAQQVFDILYPTDEDIVLQGRLCKNGPQGPDEFTRREIGCFRRAFEGALIDLDQVEAVRLRDRSLKEAQATLKKKCRYTRGQAWRCTFGKIATAMKQSRADASGPP